VTCSADLNQAGATGTLAAHGDINAQIGFVGGGTATLLINGSAAQTSPASTRCPGALPQCRHQRSAAA